MGQAQANGKGHHRPCQCIGLFKAAFLPQVTSLETNLHLAPTFRATLLGFSMAMTCQCPRVTMGATAKALHGECSSSMGAVQ